ncbi:MAG: type II toxin-antitoxin system RelE/ParE family toxin [Elusimicrobia bacterium]|nr:type II toxin-antitoxin system RelE/ParE family toxin [Elusimicrobiota bacterium]
MTISLTPHAKRNLADISGGLRDSILEAIWSLEENPRPQGCKKLRGNPAGIWRVRVGNYRIIYHIATAAKMIVILKIGPRKSIYR